MRTKELISYLTREDATHSLCCSHVFNWSSRVDYYMDCVVLKRMCESSRSKILVFGERNRKGYDDKKRIRYVSDFRLIPKGGH